jgi:two-component system sensor histidine kinase KdpD
LLAVVVIAFRKGLRPAIFTAIIGVIAFDFFFVSPYMTFRVSDSEYLITFAGMIIVGTLVSLLVTRARDHAYAAQSREKETGTLYALSQDLTVAADTGSMIAAVTRHIREIFQWESIVLLPEGDGLAVQQSESGIVLNDDDIAVASWAFQHSTVAGYDTDTLHGSRLRYIPMNGAAGVLGILGVKPADIDGIITHEQERILTAFANQMALALERVRLTKDIP